MTVKFRGKNGDWGIPVITIIIAIMAWVGFAAQDKSNITKRSEMYLKSFGYTNIELSTDPIGCRYNLTTTIDDGGRIFNALKPNGKFVSGVVCTAKNNTPILTINYEEE